VLTLTLFLYDEGIHEAHGLADLSETFPASSAVLVWHSVLLPDASSWRLLFWRLPIKSGSVWAQTIRKKSRRPT